MRNNQPITQKVYGLAAGSVLISKTDEYGRISAVGLKKYIENYCN